MARRHCKSFSKDHKEVSCRRFEFVQKDGIRSARGNSPFLYLLHYWEDEREVYRCNNSQKTLAMLRPVFKQTCKKAFIFFLLWQLSFIFPCSFTVKKGTFLSLFRSLLPSSILINEKSAASPRWWRKWKKE